ncbi:hypothetical protein FLAT13_03620 [Flavobacterium salmonis]|uniref:Uncharacterized protein n=1 Tax=Flavobacterium salmonis TaxID=2654844 RepID=A0A6V6Z5A4_9FLAO|nr:hypothetical protein FLAT13_03620 [Flavobacterium salmonis]
MNGICASVDKKPNLNDKDMRFGAAKRYCK